MFVPYARLSETPVCVLACGDVPVYLSLLEPGGAVCRVSVSEAGSSGVGDSVSVPVGTVFELEYRGAVSEIRIGKKFTVLDAQSQYIFAAPHKPACTPPHVAQSHK